MIPIHDVLFVVINWKTPSKSYLIDFMGYNRNHNVNIGIFSAQKNERKSHRNSRADALFEVKK